MSTFTASSFDARLGAKPPSSPTAVERPRSWRTRFSVWYVSTPQRIASLNDAAPTPQFVTALDMAALDHVSMMEAVQPFIDTAISKTVNVPEDYPYEDFKELYTEAWVAGLKGLATFRPNTVTGSVLSVAPEPRNVELPCCSLGS